MELSGYGIVITVMDPTIWLQQHVPGYKSLSDEERTAIEHFTLLWGLFEYSVLDTHGSPARILRAVKELQEQYRPLPIGRFEEPIAYFRRRYYDDAGFTGWFNGLCLRPSDNPALVKRFIAGETADAAEILSGLLIVVLRLRNNLFHGIKWAYYIEGQLENFQNASVVLMHAMELHRGEER